MTISRTALLVLASQLVGLIGAAALLAVLAKAPSAEIRPLWWAARASGLVAYLLLAFTMILGLLVSWRGLVSVIDQRRAFELHDQIALGSVLASGLHVIAVATLVSTGSLGWSLLSPLPATLGLLAWLGVSGLLAMRWLTRRLSVQRWRLVHRGAFAVYIAALAHAATAGSGLVESPVRWMYLLIGSMMIGVWIFRGMFHLHGGVSSAKRAMADTTGNRVEEAVEAARRAGEEVLLTVLRERGGDGLKAAWLALALRRQPHSRGEVVKIEDSTFGVISFGRSIGRAAPAIADELRTSCGAQACIGYAVYPADAWDAGGLQRAALIRLQLDRYNIERIDAPGQARAGEEQSTISGLVKA